MSSLCHLVSIIIPSYNQGKYIKETIDSILAQDYHPFEIFVMDGGSSDETVSVLKSYGNIPELKWTSEPDDGVVDAVNKGMAQARGDILTIQSSDDVFLPGALTAAVEKLSQNVDIGLVYGDVQYIDEHSQVTGEDILGEFDLREYLGRLTYIPQPGTCFTRAAMQHAGGWRKNVSYVADADFWLRIVTKFPVVKLDQFVGLYRYHPEQRDTQREQIARDWETSILDLIDCGILNSQEKRYAEMGIHLAKYRYTPETSWIQRTRELYYAMLINPFAVVDKRFPKKELFPGRTPIWAFLSRIKRALGMPPRTG